MRRRASAVTPLVSLLLVVVLAVMTGSTATAAATTPDIELASATATTDCRVVDGYADDLAGVALHAGGLRPGRVVARHVCLRNGGDGPVAVTVGLTAARSEETGCTGDEPQVDPDGPTCGTTGELHTDIGVSVAANEQCGIEPASPVRFGGVVDRPATSALVHLAPGEAACARIEAAYLLVTPPLDVVVNQTDRVRWRVRFAATTTGSGVAAGGSDPAGGTGSGGGLPLTGSDSRSLVVTGAALVAIGAALLRRSWSVTRSASSRRVVAGLTAVRKVHVSRAEGAGQLSTTSQEGTT